MFVSYNLEGFGQELRRIRKNLGFSQAEVQQKVGVSVDTIRKIESGRVIPRYDTLELLSVAYKQDLLELLKNSRSNKFLMEYHDDLDYVIARYDKDTATQLKEKLQDNFNANFRLTMVNPDELKQFITFVDAIDSYYSGAVIDASKPKQELIEALRLTIPDYNLESFDKYNYTYIEFRILLLLSLFIAREKDFAFSNRILYHILDKISDKNYNTKYVDFLIGNIYFNLAYNYHMLDDQAKVIEVADKGIDFCLEKRTTHVLHSLYYRKGIAQYHLGDPDYMESLTIAFYLLKSVKFPQLLEEYKKITREKYGIIINI